MSLWFGWLFISFFFKQKTAYEMRISDWSSDVCSSDLGAPETGSVDASGLSVVVVAGTWHDVITDGLIAGARRVLDASGASWRLVRVPGSFELPVAAQVALEAGADAVVALGVIIRGGTPPFEYVSSAATDGLTRVAP